MRWSQDELDYCRQLAENGDPYAQIRLAWQYVEGENVEKDFDKAVALFHQAELKMPSLARLYVANAKILNGDKTFADDLVEDCKAGFGPALYTMAVCSNARHPSRKKLGRSVEIFCFSGAKQSFDFRVLFVEVREKGHLGTAEDVPLLSASGYKDW